MADTKISALTDGSALADTDRIPLSRSPFASGDNRYILGSVFQLRNANLTTIGGLSPTNDDILQRKAGAWTNRTMAQLLTDLVAAGAVSASSTSTLTNKTLTAPVIASIVNTGTLTLPSSTDTLVGRATTDTLTNKTLTAPVIATISNSGTITLPTGTRTLVARDTTDTLTNKTIDLASNTVTMTLAQLNTAISDADITVLSAPSDVSYFPQRNSGNTADEYGRRYFSFVVAIPAANGTERIWQAPTNMGATITGAHAWTDAGTVTLAIKIGTTAVTGLSALSVTSTEGTDTAGTAANVMAGDDKLNATQSSMSGAAVVYMRVQGYLGRATA